MYILSVSPHFLFLPLLFDCVKFQIAILPEYESVVLYFSNIASVNGTIIGGVMHPSDIAEHRSDIWKSKCFLM